VREDRLPSNGVRRPDKLKEPMSSETTLPPPCRRLLQATPGQVQWWLDVFQEASRPEEPPVSSMDLKDRSTTSSAAVAITVAGEEGDATATWECRHNNGK
jgi:hypothetical protein